ncbi:MAG: helix-turn-helix transcriptional regulator [Pseudomonadota bacterium]
MEVEAGGRHTWCMTPPRSRPSAPKTKEQTHKAFGRRLKSLRQSQGWNQEDFASQIEMSVDAVSSMERGKTFASLDTLSKIAAALKTDIATLFEFEEHYANVRTIQVLLKNQPPEVIEAAEHQIRALVDLAKRLQH